jgi:hypothetical protein
MKNKQSKGEFDLKNNTPNSVFKEYKPFEEYAHFLTN